MIMHNVRVRVRVRVRDRDMVTNDNAQCFIVLASCNLDGIIPGTPRICFIRF